MVSRFFAFTIAVVWVAAGVAAGIVALSLSSRGIGDAGLVAAVTGALTDGFRYWLILVPACLFVATLWIGVGHRTARTSTSLGMQGALIGLATALFGLILLIIAGQAVGITPP